MKRSSILLVILAVILVFAGCAASEDSANYGRNDTMAMEKMEAAPMVDMEMADEAYYGEEATAEEMQGDGGSAADIEDYSEKIIYNASMDLVADDVVETSDKIVEMVNEMGGYVGYLNKSNYTSSSAYVNMQVRIPAKGLTDFTDYVTSLATVEYETMSSDNITEQYYDIKTRLEHQQVQAEQLEELMKQANTTEDILAVRRELSSVQETIEVYQGKIRMWDSLVNYSTVNINVRKTPTINDDDGLLRLITLGETGEAIVRGFRNSAVFVVNALSFIIRLIAVLLIPAAIITPIVILIVKLAKRNRKKKNGQIDNQ